MRPDASLSFRPSLSIPIQGALELSHYCKDGNESGRVWRLIQCDEDANEYGCNGVYCETALTERLSVF